METDELLKRLDDFADRVIRLGRATPKSPLADVLTTQLVKSGTSIGANYREAQRASSKRHFITTVEIAHARG